MRLRTCLAVLLLLPAVTAEHADGPTPGIHLYGHQEAHLVLEWDTHDLEPTRLELIRVLEGEVEVFPLEPSATAYTDVGVTAEANVTYLLYAEAYGQIGLSNVYDPGCQSVGPQSGTPPVYVEPNCIKEVPYVFTDLQSQLKQTLADLIPR